MRALGALFSADEIEDRRRRLPWRVRISRKDSAMYALSAMNEEEEKDERRHDCWQGAMPKRSAKIQMSAKGKGNKENPVRTVAAEQHRSGVAFGISGRAGEKNRITIDVQRPRSPAKCAKMSADKT